MIYAAPLSDRKQEVILRKTFLNFLGNPTRNFTKKKTLKKFLENQKGFNHKIWKNVP